MKHEKEAQSTEDCGKAFEEVMKAIRNEHNKNEREEGLISQVNDTGLTLRPELARQKTSGVDWMVHLVGLIPRVVLVKGRTKNAIKLELEA